MSLKEIPNSAKIIGASSLALLIGVGIFFQQGGFSLFGQKLKPLEIAYHKTYDGWWDVACDSESDGSNGRCYVQYVDVYSQRPDFRAAMVQIVYVKDDAGQSQPRLTFMLERDLDASAVSLDVKQGDTVAERFKLTGCSGSECVIEGPAAAKMLEAFRTGEQLAIGLPESGERPKTLSWPLQNAALFLDDFAAQRAERGYP